MWVNLFSPVKIGRITVLTLHGLQLPIIAAMLVAHTIIEHPATSGRLDPEQSIHVTSLTLCGLH
jgi:hypothetical protein